MVEDVALDAPERRRRLEPQLFHEASPVMLEPVQRLGAAPRSLQGAQQHRNRTFPEWVLDQQRFHDREAGIGTLSGQLGLGQQFERLAAQLIESRRDRLHGRVVCGVGERFPIPPRQRRAQPLCPARRRVVGNDDVLEAPGVHLDRAPTRGGSRRSR